jgi:hypothetical protein
VVATTDVLRLQKRAKKTVAKTSMWVIATLPQCGCTLIAVCLRLKKTVAETGKKVRLQKSSSKKAPCHDTVRLRLGWCLLDVVATW